MKNCLWGAAVGAAFLTNVLVAQQAPFLRIARVQLKPERIAEYVELQKKVTDAYKKTGVTRSVFQAAGFGEAAVVAAVTPVKSMAEFDKPVIQAAMGEGAYQQYMARAGNAVTKVTYEIAQPVPELSLGDGSLPETLTSGEGFLVVAQILVVPGKEAQFEQSVKDQLIPALKKAGVKNYWAHRVIMGGPTNHYRISSVAKSLGELDKGTMARRALGEAAFEKYRQSLTGILQSVTYETYKYLPEVSSR